MYRILKNSRGQGYEYESFKKEFIEICEGHKNDSKALAFAFILYKTESPELIKLLEDDDYWSALH